MSLLASAYRPLTWDEVVSQGHIVPVLKSMVQSDDVPPALIFSGPHGTGKTSCARVLAASLNCEQQGCGTCTSCQEVQRGSHNSVIEIDAASNGGVAEVRKLREDCLYGHEGRWRVIIMDECHSMSREAFNALLKMMETPLPNTVFVLVTTNSDKIIPTVQSRSMEFVFRTIPAGEVLKRLWRICEEEDLDVDRSMLLNVVRHARGGLRDAIMLLDQSVRVGAKTPGDFIEFFGSEDLSVQIIKCAMRNDFAEGYRFCALPQFAINDLAMLFTDMLVAQSGGALSHRSDTEVKQITGLAALIPTQAVVRSIELVWSAKDKMQTTSDEQAVAQMLFALVAQTFAQTGVKRFEAI